MDEIRIKTVNNKLIKPSASRVYTLFMIGASILIVLLQFDQL